MGTCCSQGDVVVSNMEKYSSRDTGKNNSLLNKTLADNGDINQSVEYKNASDNIALENIIDTTRTNLNKYLQIIHDHIETFLADLADGAVGDIQKNIYQIKNTITTANDDTIKKLQSVDGFEGALKNISILVSSTSSNALNVKEEEAKKINYFSTAASLSSSALGIAASAATLSGAPEVAAALNIVNGVFSMVSTIIGLFNGQSENISKYLKDFFDSLEHEKLQELVTDGKSLIGILQDHLISAKETAKYATTNPASSWDDLTFKTRYDLWSEVTLGDAGDRTKDWILLVQNRLYAGSDPVYKKHFEKHQVKWKTGQAENVLAWKGDLKHARYIYKDLPAIIAVYCQVRQLWFNIQLTYQGIFSTNTTQDYKNLTGVVDHNYKADQQKHFIISLGDTDPPTFQLNGSKTGLIYGLLMSCQDNAKISGVANYLNFLGQPEWSNLLDDFINTPLKHKDGTFSTFNLALTGQDWKWGYVSPQTGFTDPEPLWFPPKVPTDPPQFSLEDDSRYYIFSNIPGNYADSPPQGSVKTFYLDSDGLNEKTLVPQEKQIWSFIPYLESDNQGIYIVSNNNGRSFLGGLDPDGMIKKNIHNHINRRSMTVTKYIQPIRIDWT